jgi:DNA-directed RNA polymerase subunit omega
MATRFACGGARPRPGQERPDIMIEPPIGELLEKTQTRFALVVLAARRARQINAYFNQLGEGLGSYVPPQVHSLSRKPLSIALEEIDEDKVVIDIVEPEE